MQIIFFCLKSYFEVDHCSKIFISIFSLVFVMGTDHTTGLFIALWVVSNQMVVAILSHQWYLKNYPNYSKKAIIPFIL